MGIEGFEKYLESCDYEYQLHVYPDGYFHLRVTSTHYIKDILKELKDQKIKLSDCYYSTANESVNYQCGDWP